MNNILDTNKEKLRKIIHHSLLSAELLEGNSIVGGQMSKTILMYNYGRYINNDLYIQFADELLDLIMKKIDNKYGVSLFYGITGIAWGFLYLIENNYIAASANELLEEIDEEIMRYDPRRYNDLSLETGLCGVLYYINSRLSYALSRNEDFPFDELYYHDLTTYLEMYNGNDEDLIAQVKIFNTNYHIKKPCKPDTNKFLMCIFNSC